MATTQTFPDDENGDVLRRMQASGDDLSKPRDIDFAVLLPTGSAAEAFGQHFRDRNCAVEVRKRGSFLSRVWDVQVTRHMLPTHDGITAFEEELERQAAPLGGRNDGWGCFEQ